MEKEIKSRQPITGEKIDLNTPEKEVGQYENYTKMKSLKKMLMIMVFGMMTFLVVTPASALRVLDYEWVCRGSGGNCLDDVVVTPEML